MAGDAVIKLDLDTGAADKKADELGKKVKKVGDNADFSKGIAGLGKMLISAGMLAKAATAAFDIYSKIADRQSALSKDAGGGRLQRDLNAQKAGLGAGANALMTADGAGTMEQRDAVLAGLAGLVEGGTQIDKKESTGALRLASMGIYSQGEILDAVKAGTTADLIAGAGKRYNALSSEAQAELGTRAMEFSEKRAELEAAGEFGASARVGDARRNRARAENPILGGISETLGDIPVVGRVTEGVERAVFQGDVVGELREQTAEMKRQARGNLNLSAGSEGTR